MTHVLERDDYLDCAEASPQRYDIECRWFERSAFRCPRLLLSLASSASEATRSPIRSCARKIFYSRLCSAGERERKLNRIGWKLGKKSKHESHLNVTSLSSGLLTNFGSMRDPFTGCRTVSFIGLIGSQPKHVLKISARSSVVPSFCKHDTNNIKKKARERKTFEFSILTKVPPTSSSPFFLWFRDIKI